MEGLTRRALLQQCGVLAAGTTLEGLSPKLAQALPEDDTVPPIPPSFEWVRSARLLIAEGYCPPFFPSLDYEPEKAVGIARRLGCNAFRFPTFSYVSFFPTKTKLPLHPELGSRDPLMRTAELCHEAGIKVVAYNPLNHPFMDIRSNNPDYQDWTRRFADGRPMITTHYGWASYYEGCLNSPLRDQIRERVREVIANYPVDMMYFDGAYEGMDHEPDFCHCKYCKAAYRKARGKDIPLQDASTTLDELIEYRQWMSEDVVVGFMQEVCTMIREVRDVPMTYNNGEMLRNGWTAKAYLIPELSTFMFEASSTPEQKLFNLRAGQSTGKNIWTYIGSHTVYNREHIKDQLLGGWFSYPIEGEQLLLDAAMATAAGAGYCYWGLNRVYYLPEDVLDRPSIRDLKTMFDYARTNEVLFQSARPEPQAGILLGTQTMGWYQNDLFVPDAYPNYFYGAFQVMKDMGYDSEPFLDYRMNAEMLAKYKLVYAPNVPCLSDAQCAALKSYVEDGGTLVATHLTSVADEYGRPRKDYGLSELFGAKLSQTDPIAQIPDLYLRLVPSGTLIPQDPQVMRFEASRDATVLAETYERGYRRTFGPAVVRRSYGKGQTIYIGSGMEAIYDETLNDTVRTFFHSLIDPILAPSRPYEVDFRQGLMPEFAASDNALVLHLMANTGNIWKKMLVQETFLPVENVRVRMRVPGNRQVRSVTLLWSGTTVPWRVRDGWVELTVPRVRVYEAVRVGLAE